ncbi:MAG: ATP-binding protein, partial [Bacteroidota bacterium]
DVDPETIHIPPMMVQPFIENAVWHGLSAGGRVDVHFSKGDDRHIRCVIIDNGRGERVKSNVDLTEQVRKTSMGISLMKERFETLNQRLQTNSGFVISDRSDSVSGKEVILTLPFED